MIRTKKFLEGLSIDERLDDFEKAFQVHAFYTLVDTALGQLKIGLMDIFVQISFPGNVVTMSNSELESAASKLAEVYKHDISDKFVTELRSFRREFREELKCKTTVVCILELLLSVGFISSMPELATVCAMFAVLLSPWLQHIAHFRS